MFDDCLSFKTFIRRYAFGGVCRDRQNVNILLCKI